MPKLLVIFFVVNLLCSCTFQSQRPAPVKTLSFGSLSDFSKGSITSNRYKVKKGDTLYSIAWGANKDVKDLARLNRLDSRYTIYPGQLLLLSNRQSLQNHKKRVVNTKEGNSIKNSHLDKKNVANKKTQGYVETKSNKTNNNKAPIKRDALHKGLPSKVNQWRWPVSGKLVSGFSHSEQDDKGIKIAVNQGEFVKAAASGRVVYAGNGLRGYGNLIIIKHTHDYLSAYAHTKKILVKEKQQIMAGQKIATIGNLDKAGAVLHFEIRYHGKSVNPLKYLPKK